VLNCNQNPQSGTRNVHLRRTEDCTNNNRLQKTGTRQACVSDPNEFSYFAGGGAACPWQTAIFPWTQARAISGPNLNCPTAMLGLSGNRPQIMAKLDHMHPVPSGTHADVGLMWGLRMLSPRAQWASFFGNAATPPGAFNATTHRKVMVLLTDGENTPTTHFEGAYGCNETGANDRANAGPCWRAGGVPTLNRTALDNLTRDACTAIRTTYGVELYTIAVDVSDPTAVALLQDCAGDPARAFNVSSAALDEAFEAIARRELRLTE
jgi:hypothetical protein